MVIIGVDPHKASHTAAVVDERSQPLAHQRVAANRAMTIRLLRWAARWPERIWAIEGADGLGRLLAQQLVAAGEHVLDVPATLAAKARLLQTGHGRKTDRDDAVSVALVALHHPGLRRVEAEDHAVIMRLLSDRRDELVSERRRVINRLHRHLRDLIAGGAPRELSADTAARLLRKIKPANAVDAERKAIARGLLADVRRLDRALAENRTRVAEAVATSSTTITEIHGISDVLAAKIVGHTGNITRFRSAAHYGSYTGTAPIEASSGDVTRHRLSRAGNRKLNHALHIAARVQLLHAGPGRDHYDRKIAEGKSPTEAMRSLKRQLAKIVYRRLLDDHRQAPLAAAA